MNTLKIHLVFSILLLTLLIANGQEIVKVPFSQVAKAVVFLDGKKPKTEQINGVVHEIGIRKPGTQRFQLLTDRVTGTGFLIRNKDSLFLVTAGHVAKDLLIDTRLITSDTSGNSKSYSLQNVTTWKYSSKADVAVSVLNNKIFITDFMDKAIDISLLADSITFPVPELPLAVIGFPLGLGVQNKFSPLRRETKAASALIDLPRADVKKVGTFFVLQDPSIGGYSGAPVFVIESYKFGNTIMQGFDASMCIGVIHGTISDETGGKMGLVTPAEYVYELIK